MGFFRSQSIGEGWNIITHAALVLPQLLDGSPGGFDDGWVGLGWWLTLPVWLAHFRAWAGERTVLGQPGRWERSAYAGIMLAGILTMYSTAQQFIYFQF